MFLLFGLSMFLYVPPGPTQYIFHTHMARYSLFLLKVPLNTNKTNKQNRVIYWWQKANWYWMAVYGVWWTGSRVCEIWTYHPASFWSQRTRRPCQSHDVWRSVYIAVIFTMQRYA